MSWTRFFMIGDVGQQIDIDDIESDVERLRTRVHAQATANRAQDDVLLSLQRELDDLKLVVAELARLLVAGGTLPAAAVERVVRGVDRTAGSAAVPPARD